MLVPFCTLLGETETAGERLSFASFLFHRSNSCFLFILVRSIIRILFPVLVLLSDPSFPFEALFLSNWFKLNFSCSCVFFCVWKLTGNTCLHRLLDRFPFFFLFSFWLSISLLFLFFFLIFFLWLYSFVEYLHGARASCQLSWSCRSVCS